MKNMIIAVIALASVSSFAHMIEGTQILKGSIKTRIVVNNLRTTCKVKVEKVKNLMQEDSFGNPAYNVRVDISLDGSNSDRTQLVKFDREIWFNNLFITLNGTEVRDLEYATADGARMMIDSEGRIKSVSFPSPYKTITCSF